MQSHPKWGWDSLDLGGSGTGSKGSYQGGVGGPSAWRHTCNIGRIWWGWGKRVSRRGGSREHQNQGPSDPQVSKVLGALCPQGVIRAQCWTSREPGSLCNQVPRSLTFTQCLETGKHKVLHRVQMPTAFPVVTPRCLHLPSVTGPQRTVLNPPRGENLLTTPLAQFCRFPALTLLATYPEEWLLRCKSLGRNCPGGGGRCIRRKRETWSTSSRSSHQRSLKHNQFWTKQWKTFWKWQELWPQSRQEMASWTI